VHRLQDAARERPEATQADAAAEARPVIDILSDPDWPLAMGVLAEANGWEVERITLAEDVWLALVDKVPMRDATTAGSPLATTLGVPVLVDRLLAPGDGYALLRNGQVRRLFGRATTSARPSDGE
jgi:hypothetical protein